MKITKRTVWFAIPLLVFVGLVLMLANRLGKPTDIVASTALNKPVPSFELPLLSDPARKMGNADLPKEAFILNVWGSWCRTCYVEHPFLMTLHGQGVPMVGVNYKDELSSALNYLNDYKDPFVYSVQDYEGKLAMDLGLTGAPESFVVDKAGVVWLHIVGELHEQNWTNQVKPCMNALNDDALDQTAKTKACRGVS